MIQELEKKFRQTESLYKSCCDDSGPSSSSKFSPGPGRDLDKDEDPHFTRGSLLARLTQQAKELLAIFKVAIPVYQSVYNGEEQEPEQKALLEFSLTRLKEQFVCLSETKELLKNEFKQFPQLIERYPNIASKVFNSNLELKKVAWKAGIKEIKKNKEPKPVNIDDLFNGSKDHVKPIIRKSNLGVLDLDSMMAAKIKKQELFPSRSRLKKISLSRNMCLENGLNLEGSLKSPIPKKSEKQNLNTAIQSARETERNPDFVISNLSRPAAHRTTKRTVSSVRLGPMENQFQESSLGCLGEPSSASLPRSQSTNLIHFRKNRILGKGTKSLKKKIDPEKGQTDNIFRFPPLPSLNQLNSPLKDPITGNPLDNKSAFNLSLKEMGAQFQKKRFEGVL